MKATCISRRTTDSTDRAELAHYVYCMDLVRAYPRLLTENTMRGLLRNRHENGLATAVRHIGRRLFIHVPTFEAWLDTQIDRD